MLERGLFREFAKNVGLNGKNVKNYGRKEKVVIRNFCLENREFVLRNRIFYEIVNFW